MQNERFERAARSRRLAALSITILFHLGLLAWVLMYEQQKATPASTQSPQEMVAQQGQPKP